MNKRLLLVLGCLTSISVHAGSRSQLMLKCMAEEVSEVVPPLAIAYMVYKALTAPDNRELSAREIYGYKLCGQLFGFGAGVLTAVACANSSRDVQFMFPISAAASCACDTVLKQQAALLRPLVNRNNQVLDPETPNFRYAIAMDGADSVDRFFKVSIATSVLAGSLYRLYQNR